jgi:hypothetical protein
MPAIPVAFHNQRFLPLDIFSHSDIFLVSSENIPCTLTIHDSCGMRQVYETTITREPYKISKELLKKIVKNDYIVLEINPKIKKVLHDEPYEIQVYDDKN